MTKEDIQQDIKTHSVILYMKGTATQPVCGFSAVVVQILKKLNVPFEDRNVLEDSALRQNIKEFSHWPTIPQLYVCGEFIGGADIVRDLYARGDLEALFIEKGLIVSA